MDILILNEMIADNILSASEGKKITSKIASGSTLISAFKGEKVEHIAWKHLAERYKKVYYSEKKNIRVLFTDLINFEDVLRLGLIPQRTRGLELQALTYDPTYPLNTRYNEFIITPYLITPSLWRELYDLCYPTELTGKLNIEQAQALVGFSRLGSAVTLSPEQATEAVAISQGYMQINLQSSPPNEQVKNAISLPNKALYNCYPHHLNSDGCLVMLMVNPSDSESIASLRRQTQLEIVPAIANQSDIDRLVEWEDAESQI